MVIVFTKKKHAKKFADYMKESKGHKATHKKKGRYWHVKINKK